MNYDITLGDRARCGGRDRDECVTLVRRIVELAEMARTQGLLAIEDEPMEADPAALRIGVRLTVEGTDPETVRTVLSRFVLFGRHEGKELLKRLIILEGVLAIGRGDQPPQIEILLLSFLGENTVEHRAGERRESWDEGFDDFAADAGHAQATSEIPGPVAEQLMAMDDRFVQKVLREIDENPLAVFLATAPGEAREKVLRNMSLQAAEVINELIADLGQPPDDDIRASVTLLDGIITKLREMREIP